MYLTTCVANNYKLCKIAKSYNYKLGARLPTTVYDTIFFGDQEWKVPNRQGYMDSIAKYRPYMATVLDLERENQYNEVMSWADQISNLVEEIIIIPKYNGIIPKIPEKINNKNVILGYSTPTKYAGTTVPIEEFGRRPVHLLGGNPFQHLTLCKKMNVISIDCNFHLKMANTGCQYFSNMPIYTARNPNWPTIYETEGKRFNGDGNAEAFKRSCEAILDFWRFHGFRITL